MFGLNVTFVMKPGKTKEFLEGVAANGSHAAIRKEEGCLQYDFFLPVEGEEKILLVEKWTCADAQKVHMTQPHMKQFAAVRDACIQQEIVETYDLP